MATLFDRLNQELDTFGKRAQSALDEGRLQLERFRIQRERDEAARKLGYVVYRRDRGTTVDPLEVDAWFQRLDRLGEELARIERQLATARAEPVSVSTAPPPASAETGEAEVITTQETAQ